MLLMKNFTNEKGSMITDFLADLNESQKAAVEYLSGPELVIAGAGSGKTRVLTYKVAYLIGQGIEPWNILALTFTNKAAREMQERIARQVGSECAARLWMGTFHSIFSRILRTEARVLGYTPNYTIYDQADARNLVKTIIREMGLDEKVYKPQSIASQISVAKNRLITPAKYLSSSAMLRIDEQNQTPMIGEIYSRYRIRCMQADAMDFDDLLLNTFILFDQFPDVRCNYASRFRYILVDEYQDTNYAQHAIIWQLAQEQQNLCVVGDDAQSIYSFRGADIGNILNFTRQYSGARIFKLEQNYRSTQTIVAAANSLIAHNKSQIPKEIYSKNDLGDPIQVFSAYSDLEEAEIVARKIQELCLCRHVDYNDIAVLYRTNSQSRVFEEVLRRNSVPYRIYGGLSFYQRKEVKDVIAYFRMAVNPHDEEAFKRIINYPARGIGQTTLEKLQVAASDHGVSLWTILEAPETYGVKVNKGTLGRLMGFHALVTGFIEQAGLLAADELGELIIREAGILTDLRQDNSPESMSRQENVEELLNGLRGFVDGRREEGVEEALGMSDFLQVVSLLSDQDNQEDPEESKVTLMTVHSAKGLEFCAVFIVGLEEDLFPSAMASDTPRGLEEERRLFYVALTRAETFCFLSYAMNRYRYGKSEFCNPSRFLRELDARWLSASGKALSALAPVEKSDSHTRTQFMDRVNSCSVGSFARVTGLKVRPAETVRALSEVKTKRQGQIIGNSGNVKVQNTVSGLQEGCLIEHERFGIGKVIRLEGDGDNKKATVTFEHVGTKQLLLRFARFKVL